MKRVQVCEAKTGDSDSAIVLQCHLPIAFHEEEKQDYEYPEEEQIRGYRCYESSQLMFSQGPADNDLPFEKSRSLAHLPIFGSEDSEDSQLQERGLMDEIDFVGIEQQDEDIFMRELRRNNEGSPQEEHHQMPSDEEDQDMAGSVTQEAFKSTGSSEGSRQEGQITPESRSLNGLNANWRRILQQFQDIFHRFKKSVNMPKAIGRYFMEQYPTFQKTIFGKDPLHFAELSERLQQLKKWVKESKKNSFKLEHLNEFFGDGVTTRRHSQLRRLMMRKILQRRLREEIIPNNQVKDKLEYLVSTKVYGLRCGNAQLAKRMQMR